MVSYHLSMTINTSKYSGFKNVCWELLIKDFELYYQQNIFH